MPQSPSAVIVGNSDGIGLALTRRLLADGWTVTGLSRSASPVTHAEYVHHVADVTDPAFAATLAGVLPARIDLCVYAAGIGEELDLADLGAQTRTIEVNLLGAARTVEAVVPALTAAGGHLIGLSSLADVLISKEAPGYSASKAALTSYLLGLRKALRPHGVAVTVVRFGFVRTKMAKAPSLPMVIEVERAVEVLMRAVRRRPALVSYPRRMAAVVRVLRLAG